MFVGHLAVAFGAKSLDRKLPLGLLIGASFGVDILWPIFLLLGLETVRIDPGNTVFTPLDFVSYPWSHSLLFVAVWAVLLGLVARRFGISKSGSVIAGLLVLSHWVLDLVMHRPDLPLWPGSQTFGLGLWNSLAGTFFVEGGLLAVCIGLYLAVVSLPTLKGKIALWSLIALCVFIWASQPFSPAPPNAQAVAFVGLTMLLLPLWGMWIDRNSSARAIQENG
ncbi:hypothetical protein HQ496_05705 [bacterium]|nr:hypothetical protein [bacterium]